jgi:hypothetical protein
MSGQQIGHTLILVHGQRSGHVASDEAHSRTVTKTECHTGGRQAGGSGGAEAPMAARSRRSPAWASSACPSPSRGGSAKPV